MNSVKNSDLIIPMALLVNLAIINLVLYTITPETYFYPGSIIYYNVSWVIIAYLLDYQPIERNDTFLTKAGNMFMVFLFYGVSYFAFFGITQMQYGSIGFQLIVYSILSLSLLWFRVLFFWIRRNYRFAGGNSVSVVVLGMDTNAKTAIKLFENPYLGYRYMGYFDDAQSESQHYLGDIGNSFLYILNNDVDEIYCVASKFNRSELEKLMHFADNNLIKLKLILDNKEIYSRAMSIESYEQIPILNIRKVPLDTEYARVVKRTFDIIFSILVIIFVLSWIAPILFILIKLDSPGTPFFRQKRHGYKRRTFWCYKFRSMVINEDADSKMTSKGDKRITRFGKFLRKYNVDELPQFYNVLIGDMSVVGPRPHMELHTNDFENSVDRYLVRHFVKPGVTGLAQVKGYRGEIKERADILNRTRLDIFYVEKWTLGLDLKIIGLTILNLFKGEEKAY